MTLPLLTQDRTEMHGDRYRGFIASILRDLEHGDSWWEHGMEFQANIRPPFPWAGHKQETTDVTHIGDIRHTYGDGDPRQAGAVTDNTRPEQEAAQAAVYRITDDPDERRDLMEMLFSPLRPFQTSTDNHRYKGGRP